jgi:hypothetical protein
MEPGGDHAPPRSIGYNASLRRSQVATIADESDNQHLGFDANILTSGAPPSLLGFGPVFLAKSVFNNKSQGRGLLWGPDRGGRFLPELGSPECRSGPSHPLAGSCSWADVVIRHRSPTAVG